MTLDQLIDQLTAIRARIGSDALVLLPGANDHGVEELQSVALEDVAPTGRGDGDISRALARRVDLEAGREVATGALRAAVMLHRE